MKNYVNAIFLLLMTIVSAHAAKPKLYEMPRTQVMPIVDSESGRKYELYIKLPDDYLEDGETVHPVIYFTDAVWHIEMLSASTEYLMENAILVGVSWQKDMKEDLVEELGAHASRFRDYSVTELDDPDRQAKYQMGQAGDHLNFIRRDVITHIEKSYRADVGNRTYFGYSLGGVFGAYVLVSEPETFSNYILGSPALRGDIPFLSNLKSKRGTSLNARVFISCGELEVELCGYVDEFVGLLNNPGDQSLSLRHVVLEGSHQTAFPRAALRSIAWLSDLVSGGEGG